MSGDVVPGLREASVTFEGTYDPNVWAPSLNFNPERDIVVFPKGMRPWHPMLTSRGTITWATNTDGETIETISGDFELKWPWRHEHVGVVRWAKHVWKQRRTEVPS